LRPWRLAVTESDRFENWPRPQTIVAADRAVWREDGFTSLEAETEGSSTNSDTTVSDGGLDCPVTWPQGSLEALAGQTVRFRIQVKRAGTAEPRLYALYLR
jgi:hypothetical protein